MYLFNFYMPSTWFITVSVLLPWIEHFEAWLLNLIEVQAQLSMHAIICFFPLCVFCWVWMQGSFLCVNDVFSGGSKASSCPFAAPGELHPPSWPPLAAPLPRHTHKCLWMLTIPVPQTRGHRQTDCSSTMMTNHTSIARDTQTVKSIH